jgi:hypothetical protein
VIQEQRATIAVTHGPIEGQIAKRTEIDCNQSPQERRDTPLFLLHPPRRESKQIEDLQDVLRDSNKKLFESRGQSAQSKTRARGRKPQTASERGKATGNPGRIGAARRREGVRLGLAVGEREPRSGATNGSRATEPCDANASGKSWAAQT